MMAHIAFSLRLFGLFLTLTHSVLGTVPALPGELTQGGGSNHSSEPCARLHHYMAMIVSSRDLAPDKVNFPIPAELAYSCAMSAPLVKTEALRLVDVITALLEWHSTLAFLKEPPPGYLLSATDLMADARELRMAVQNGTLTSELAFQQNLTNILSSAHDGHLFISLDAMRVFGYVRTFDDIVSVSLDGKSSPEIFAYQDIQQHNANSKFIPSPIIMINGQDAASWVLYEALNTSSSQHDPDAMYNTFMKSPATGGGFVFCGKYPGTNTTVTFKNGTVVTYPTTAMLLRDFTDVVDGQTFYQKFVTGNAQNQQQPTSKSAIAGNNTISRMGEITASGRIKDPYPAPLYSTDDYAISGYFMNAPGFESVAVLTLRSFSPADIRSFQSNLTEFLQTCVLHGKEHLILDIQGNGGGNIGLGYDVFKQLFPDTEPYAAGNLRSHDQLNVMGEFFTQRAHDVLRDTGSIQNYTDVGGYSFFDARAFNNASGQKFDSWDEFNGPILSHGDNFTNLARLDIENADYENYLSGITFNEPPIQPFLMENIIILADGDCASTCDTFMHLMKWQGRVKTIVGGGRPKPGPMQFVGGVKARRKLSIGYMVYMVQQFYTIAPKDIQEKANQTKLKEVFESGDYLARRSDGTFSLNLGNGIVKDDATLTPLQFVYEAADCRVWWRPEYFSDINPLWALVAGTAFGLNNTEKWAACVEGSTNHPSSVTGGGRLVFDSTPTLANETSQPGSEGGGSTSRNNQSAVGKAEPQGGDSKNSASTIAHSMAFWFTALIFGSVLNMLSWEL